MVRHHRAVACPIGAHDEVVLFVVALAVGSVEHAEFGQQRAADPQGKADRGGHQCETRQAAGNGQVALQCLLR